MAETSKAKVVARDRGWLSMGIVFLAAVLFGVFVLPRLSGSLEGSPAPDFVLDVMHGGEAGSRVRLSEQRGKPIILDFWASWCAPCRQQTPVLASIHNQFAGAGLTVIGINVDENKDAARAYLEEVKAPWVVVEDPAGAATNAFDARLLPTIVAIGRDGKVFAVRRRYVPQRELASIAEAITRR